MKYLASIWLFTAVVLSGCSFKSLEMQLIDITTYPDDGKNIALLKELIYYDPAYITHKIKSLNDATAKGVKLGYFVRSSDGKPTYRITYNRSIPAVSDNIDALKSEFKEFIPELASIHASKHELFQNLLPVGQEWATSLSHRSAEDILSTGSSVLRESITKEDLSRLLEEMKLKLGDVIYTGYLRAQFYEAFNDVPESVTIFYLQTYENGNSMEIRVSFNKEKDKWLVMGIRLFPSK